MDWLRQWKYRALLLALFLLLVAHPLLSDVIDAPLAYDLMVGVVFVAAFLVLITESYLRVPAILLGLPTLAGNWMRYALPGLPHHRGAVAFHICAALFLALTTALILRDIYRKEKVSADSVCGAICGYVLIGLTFGHLFWLVEAVTPGSFRLSSELVTQFQNEDLRYPLLTYFSLVTLTTAGYGDIVPVQPPSRWLAAVEAMLGQLYLACLIAELVGRRVAQAFSDPRPK
jgi:voltage-gated potassium channel